MKITGNSLGVFAPSRVRRKRIGGQLPPWYAEVPPDTIDIALLPRINRYERGPLRFHHFGSTQQKFAERLAIFRDSMGEIEPGIAHDREEMIEELQEIMRARQERLRESRDRSAELIEPTQTAQQADLSSETFSSAPTDAQVTSPASAVDQALNPGSPDQERAHAESEAALDSPSAAPQEEEFQGAPTQWLINRLKALESRKPSPA